MLSIRLARIGKKKKPFYRVVVIEKSRPRNGRTLEVVGTYDPLQKPALGQVLFVRLANGEMLDFLDATRRLAASERPRSIVEVVHLAPAVGAVDRAGVRTARETAAHSI